MKKDPMFWLEIAGLFIAILGLVVTITLPQIQCFLGLTACPPAATPTNTPVSVGQVSPPINTSTPSWTPSLLTSPSATATAIQTTIPFENILIADSFERGPTQGWKYDPAAWQVVQDDSNSVLQKTGRLTYYAEIGDERWQNYAVEFRVKVSQDGEPSRVYVQTHDDGSRKVIILFNFTENTATVYEVAHAADATERRTVPIGLSANEWITILVQLVDHDLRVLVNNRPIISGLSLADVSYQGVVRLSYSGLSDAFAIFDDVRIWTIGSPFYTATPTPTPTPTLTRTPTPTPTPIPFENILIAEGFEYGTAQGWTYSSTDWQIVHNASNGVLQKTGELTHYAEVGDREWRNYTVEFRVRVSQDDEPSRVYVQTHDDGTRKVIVLFNFAENTVTVYEVAPGADITERRTIPIALPANEWVTLQVQLIDHTLRVIVNDRPILARLSVADVRYQGVVHVTYSGLPDSYAFFDDVRIWTVQPDPN